MSSRTSISRLNPAWINSSSAIPELRQHGSKHEQLSEILKRLTEGKETLKTSRAHSLIPAIIHVMATNLPDKDLQITCANILTILARNDEADAEIGHREGVQALRDCLVLHQDDSNLCQAVVITLHLLTFVADNRARMLRHDVVSHLINTMNTFIDHETLAEYIPATVANIVFGCSQTRAKSGQLGAIASFTEALLKHSSSSRVVAQCAFGIRNLVWECPSNLERVIQNQTVDAMLNALSANKESHEVVTQMLGAFANMVSSDKGIRASLMNKKEFFIDMLDIMSTFVGDSNIFAAVSFVFSNLGEHDIKRERASALAIANLCKDTNSYSTIAAGLGNAIRNKNETAVAKCCHLIHVLSASEDFRQEMGRLKTLEVSINALRAEVFKDEISISKLLCGIWSIMSGNDTAKLNFKELGGFPVTLEVMKTNMKSVKVAVKCTQVLDIAADGQIETTEHLLDQKEETIRLLLVAMADFPDSAKLQENACSILVKIANISPEEAAKLVLAGARPSVEVTKSRHGGNPGVESLANQLLSLLVENSTGREGRSNTRGKASSRLRSRSRTVQSGGRSRSRAEKSKSPDRMLKQARRALEAAKMRQGVQDGKSDFHRAVSAPVQSVKRDAKKLSLEPIFE